MPSVTFLVNSTSRLAWAPMKLAALVLASSNMAVARSAMAYTPRCTLAWVVS